jgi:hypothetical protein
MKPAPQMAELEPFIGSWTGTSEMVTADPTAMKEMTAMMEKAGHQGEMPKTCKGANTMEWTLNGMFMKSDGWMEMGPDMKMHMTEYYTWDPTIGKYRYWMFSDFGEVGQGTMTMEPTGKTFRMSGDCMQADGTKCTSTGTMTFTDANTMQWTWTADGKSGKMEFRGTSKKN